MTSPHRLENILTLLAENGHVSVDEALTLLNVSPATIRRDFMVLEENGLATRIRGGITTTNITYDLPLRYKVSQLAEYKQSIGNLAASLIPHHAIVGFNGGTTVLEVARALAIREIPTEAALTIVTNAINIAAELTIRPHIKVIMTGGVARQKSYEVMGNWSRMVLESLFLDWAILGADALETSLGMFAGHEGEAEINSIMVERSHKVMAVLDSSKIGHTALAKICATEQIDVLVTDSRITDKHVNQLEAADVLIKIANIPS